MLNVNDIQFETVNTVNGDIITRGKLDLRAEYTMHSRTRPVAKTNQMIKDGIVGVLWNKFYDNDLCDLLHLLLREASRNPHINQQAFDDLRGRANAYLSPPKLPPTLQPESFRPRLDLAGNPIKD